MKHGVRLLFFLIGTVALGQQPTALEPNVSPSERQHILDGNCTLFTSVREMPESLKTAFGQLTRESTFELADSGQRFQVGDVVVSSHLPRRRLILAGTCADHWFVHYERGGMAHSIAIVLFQSEQQGSLKFILGMMGLHKSNTVTQLREEVESGNPISDPGAYW